jgi:hypothetical protein
MLNQFEEFPLVNVHFVTVDCTSYRFYNVKQNIRMHLKILIKMMTTFIEQKVRMSLVAKTEDFQ